MCWVVTIVGSPASEFVFVRGDWVFPTVGSEFLGVSNCWFGVSDDLLYRVTSLTTSVTNG